MTCAAGISAEIIVGSDIFLPAYEQWLISIHQADSLPQLTLCESCISALAEIVVHRATLCLSCSDGSTVELME